MSLDALPINVFDVLLIAVFVLGIFRGRKNGMSEELLNLVKWLAVVIGCGFAYEPVGTFLSQMAPISLLSSYLLAYLGIGAIILGFFALIKHSLGGKLIGSDIFGRAEYYLGMGSGAIRCVCMLLAAIAVLNARYFSPMEVKARENYQNEMYGSNFFPGLETAQSLVFKKSLAGPWIKDNLGFLLIKPTRPQNVQLHQKEFGIP